MPDRSDQHYYLLERANTARKLARQAVDADIAAIHLDMATRYEAQAADCRFYRPSMLADDPSRHR